MSGSAWDKARSVQPDASDAQMRELRRLIEAHEDTDRNIELLWEWTWKNGRPHAGMAQATINYLKKARRE